MKLSPNYLQAVRDQYEDYPYPKRDPEEEKNRIITTYYDALDVINYYCFEGKQDFSNHFRVLIAGGGTGDALIYLAAQLRHTNAEIVYVDISKASMAIAQKRAAIRQLTNITWIHDSLLNIPQLDLGLFDYINASGILHHLADPSAGLRVLAAALKDDGAMGIMIYGQYGRSFIYHIQSLMRILCQHITHPQEKVDLCNAVLAQFPVSDYSRMALEQFKQEHETNGDIGIYDLFLHTQDRAYSIPEFYDWAETNGLKLLDLIAINGLSKLLYNPATYIRDAELLEKIGRYPAKTQQTIAELAGGNLPTHAGFMTKDVRKKPQADELSNVPSLSIHYHSEGIYEQIYEGLKAQYIPGKTEQLTLTFPGGDSIIITPRRYTLELLRYIDGSRSIGEIIDAVIAEGAAEENQRDELLSQFCALFHEFNAYDWMLLRHKSAKPCKTVVELSALHHTTKRT